MALIRLILILILTFSYSLLWSQKPIKGILNPTLKAGVHKINITPPLHIPLGGYANRSGSATGVRDSLYTVAIVFDDGKTKIAIITLDIIQVKYNEGQQIYRAIEKLTGLKERQVIINASHTHGSPWLETDSCYKEEVVKKVAGAAKVALENMYPVCIGYGEGKIGFNVNRRIVTANGECYNGLNPEGITDHRVKVLRIDKQTDAATPVAILFHAVCHPNVFRWQNTKITADFPGEAKSFVEKNFDYKSVALFLQGCAGDIRANLPEEGKAPEEPSFGRNGSEADMRWCSWSTGSAVIKTATWLGVNEQAIQRSKSNDIRAVSGMIKVSAKQSGGEVLWPREHIIDGKAHLSVKIISVGQICLVALPGEPVVEYGLKIEKQLQELGFDHVLVMGYSDGDAGYIPTKKMFEEGGYEVTESALLPSCEEEIISGITKLAGKLIKNNTEGMIHGN